MIKLEENNESTEVPVTVDNSNSVDPESNSESNYNKDLDEEQTELKDKDNDIKSLQELLTIEKQKVSEYEEKLKHTLADFQNLQRKTQSDIENGVNEKIDKFMLEFLQIYDDFIRAKDVAAENKIVTTGFDSILKNMTTLLSKYGVTPIESIGEIFNPNYHEAISVVEDDSLDDSTITKEIRKGYISHQRVIRPALVEISKKIKSE